jgi:(1->4)-alpha-D-glucan 1-alpha-D-glucosylmutase
MLKATREAKVHTSWVNPNEDYDAAMRDFVLRLLPDDADTPFADDLRALQRRVAYYGHLNSLSQVLLKATSPGVPDTYQGTELWDFSLVDPDNRRAVDFASTTRLLAQLKSGEPRPGIPTAELITHWQDQIARPHVRPSTAGHPELFLDGDYLPPGPRPAEEHVVACPSPGPAWSWSPSETRAGLCAPDEAPLGQEVWGDTGVVLPRRAPQSWHNVLTGETLDAARSPRATILSLAETLRSFPVALLYATSG